MIKPMLIQYQLAIKMKYRDKRYCPVISQLAMKYFEDIGRHFLSSELLAVMEQISRGDKPDISNYKYLINETTK